MTWALSSVAWQHEHITLFGERRRVPRLVAWYGDPGIGYRYSGVDHIAQGWPEPFTDLRRRLELDLGIRSNFVLLNRYRNGLDSMGWHADDERELLGPVISVSLGATRRLHLRKQRRDPTQTLTLGHGDLLVHPRDYPHALPKTKQAVGERVNLTFRQVESL